jgi:hypothetical protein
MIDLASFLTALYVKLSMKTIINILSTLFAVCLFTQKVDAQHQISIQTNPLNYFFDQTPQKTNDDGFSPFSLGLQYQYQKPSLKLVSVQFNIFSDANKWSAGSVDSVCLNLRRIKETNVLFSNQKQFVNKLNWTYGLGPTLRTEFFAIDTVATPQDAELIDYYQSNHLQLGVKGQIAIHYTPLNWLTVYSQLNFSGYLLSRQIARNYNEDFINDFGLNQRFNYPSRFHASLTFGVGINF